MTQHVGPAKSAALGERVDPAEQGEQMLGAPVGSKGRDDHAPGQSVGHRGAALGADQMQAGVESTTGTVWMAGAGVMDSTSGSGRTA